MNQQMFKKHQKELFNLQRASTPAQLQQQAKQTHGALGVGHSRSFVDGRAGKQQQQQQQQRRLNNGTVPVGLQQPPFNPMNLGAGPTVGMPLAWPRTCPGMPRYGSAAEHSSWVSSSSSVAGQTVIVSRAASPRSRRRGRRQRRRERPLAPEARHQPAPRGLVVVRGGGGAASASSGALDSRHAALGARQAARRGDPAAPGCLPQRPDAAQAAPRCPRPRSDGDLPGAALLYAARGGREVPRRDGHRAAGAPRSRAGLPPAPRLTEELLQLRRSHQQQQQKHQQKQQAESIKLLAPPPASPVKASPASPAAAVAAEAAAEAVEAEAVAESVEAPAAAAAADSELSVVVMNDYEQWRTLPGIVLSAGPLPQLQRGSGPATASIYMPVKSGWLVRVPRAHRAVAGEPARTYRPVREMSGCKLFVEKNARTGLRNVWLSGLEDQKAWAEHAV